MSDLSFKRRNDGIGIVMDLLNPKSFKPTHMFPLHDKWFYVHKVDEDRYVLIAPPDFLGRRFMSPSEIRRLGSLMVEVTDLAKVLYL